MNGSSAELHEWKGRDVRDNGGDKIGTVEDLYYDEVTGKPQWLLVKTGLFGTKRTLVPANEVTVRDDDLFVPYTQERVKDAARVDKVEELTKEQERELYSYYNLDYAASAQPVRWGPGDEISEEEMRRRLGRPSECIRLDKAIFMEPVLQDEEEL